MNRSHISPVRVLLSTFLVMLAFGASAQEYQSWGIAPDTSNVKYQGKLFETPDANLIFIGAVYYLPAQDSGYVALVKMDHEGNILAHREYSLYGLSLFYDAVQVSDGYVLTGKSIAAVTSAFVMKIGDDLEIEWLKSPGGFDIDSDQFSTVIQADGALHIFSSSNPGHFDTRTLTMTPDGTDWQLKNSVTQDSSTVRVFDAVATGIPSEFLTLGYVRDIENLDFESLIMHQNAAGVSWAKRIHFDTGDFGSPSGIRKSSDGNYLVTINNSSAATSIFSSYLFKMDANGAVIWSKSYTLPSAHVLLGVPLEMDNGDLLITGIEGQAQTPNLIRLDPQGDVIWTKSWSSGIAGSLGIMDLIKLGDGSFRMLTGGDHIGVTALDPEGNGCGLIDTEALIANAYTLDFTNYSLSSMTDTLENESPLFFDRNLDYSTVDDCSLTIGIEESELIKLHIHPNPTAGRIEINLPMVGEYWSYHIYDMQGRILDAGTLGQWLDLSTLASGPMMLHITDGNHHLVKQLLKY